MNSDMHTTMDSWRTYQKEAEIENLIFEINQLANEIVEFADSLTQQKLLNEGFARKAKEWLGDKWAQLSGLANKLYSKTAELYQKSVGGLVGKANDAYLMSMVKIYTSLQKFFPSKEETAHRRTLEAMSESLYELLDEKLGEYYQEKIKEAVADALNTHMSHLKTDIPRDRAGQKEYLNLNSKDIAEVIKKAVVNHEVTKDVKNVIANFADPAAIEEKFTEKLLARGISLKSIKAFTVGGSFMFTFGIIDNVGLFVGMAAVEDYLMNAGYDQMTAAGFGNTLSDALGVILGSAVAAVLYKTLKVKGEGTFAQQLVGVVAGCLVPVAIKMAWMNLVARGYLPPD